MTLPLNVVHRMKSSRRRSKVITVVLVIAFWILFVIMACMLVSDKQKIDEVTEARDAAIAEQKQLNIEIARVQEEKRKVDVKLAVSAGAQKAAEQSRDALAGEFAQSAQDLKAAVKAMEAFKDQVDQSKQNRNALVTELREAQAQLENCQTVVTQLEAANAQLKQETVVAQLRERTAQLEEVEAQLTECKQTRDVAVTELKNAKAESQLKEEWDAAAAISKAEGDERMLLQHRAIYTWMEDVRAKLEAENKQLRKRAADRDGTGRAHSLPRPQKSLYRM